MKKLTILSLLLLPLLAVAQTYNAAYVKQLYAKYPTKKHSLCPACKIWVNPYYTSIADTQRHMPICTKEVLTAAHYALTAKVKIPRSGVFGGWQPVTGQPNEDNVYTAANKAVKPKGDEIAKGHCNAWILNAWCQDAAILSDTYTFNAACESQGQNVGTEIASENYTRQLLATQDVTVWVGTFGSQGTFTDGKVTDTFPAYYWKIIKTANATICYWMPNNKSESVAMLPKRVVSYQQLVANLHFDPEKILP
ncbi:MAG TPA: DNA/RNA non-specific endonuclease [Bacteroidia bacterium]|nr:DNA/RNA non-specific endonuclease [Bacteroidia bacterium]